MDRRFMPSQKNDVFKLIVGNGMNPADFAWNESQCPSDPGTFCNRLTHKPSGYYYQQDVWQTFDDTKLICSYSPGHGTMQVREVLRDYKHELAAIQVWLGSVKRETGQPDLWGQVSISGPFPVIATRQGEAKLAEEERKRISQEMNRLLEIIADGLTNADALPKVQEQVAYLVEQANSQTRKNWEMLFYGFLFGLFANGLYDPARAKELLLAGSSLIRIVFPAIPLVTH